LDKEITSCEIDEQLVTSLMPLLRDYSRTRVICVWIDTRGDGYDDRLTFSEADWLQNIIIFVTEVYPIKLLDPFFNGAFAFTSFQTLYSHPAAMCIRFTCIQMLRARGP
jgi:hypothetical protein